MRLELELESAIEKCCQVQGVLDRESIPIDRGCQRVLAENLIALGDVPPFRHSLVDGFAISSDDRKKLSEGLSLSLEILGIIPAGGLSSIKITPGTSTRVMTGACLPNEVAAVIKQETVQVQGGTEVLISPGVLGQLKRPNIREQGSIITKGQVLAGRGEVLDHLKLELLVSAGISYLPVFRQPRLYIINTGSELATPGRLLPPGKIYNSNFTMLKAQLERAGCLVLTGRGNIPDRLQAISQEIEEGLEQADMLIITGGAAEGAFDLVPAALRDSRAEILFSLLNIKPGARTSAACKDGKIIYSLPGSPGAGDLLFEVLIKPVLRKLKGIREFANSWFEITLDQSISGHRGCRIICRGELVARKGSFWAHPLAKQEPGTGIHRIVMDVEPGTGMKGDRVRAIFV